MIKEKGGGCSGTFNTSSNLPTAFSLSSKISMVSSLSGFSSQEINASHQAVRTVAKVGTNVAGSG